MFQPLAPVATVMALGRHCSSGATGEQQRALYLDGRVMSKHLCHIFPWSCVCFCVRHCCLWQFFSSMPLEIELQWSDVTSSLCSHLWMQTFLADLVPYAPNILSRCGFCLVFMICLVFIKQKRLLRLEVEVSNLLKGLKVNSTMLSWR